MPWFQISVAQTLGGGALGTEPPGTLGTGPPPKVVQVRLLPQGACKTASNQRLFLSLKIEWNSPCYILDLLGDHHSFLLPYFSFWEWETLLYACPSIVFWKHRTCLVSQVYSWKGILLQDKLYLISSLTHSSFR